MADILKHKNTDILIVDDTPANLQLLNSLLKKEGYKVRLLPSGKMALDAINEEPPVLILLDINMPEMNGFEVCEKIKSSPETKDIPPCSENYHELVKHIDTVTCVLKCDN